MSFYGDLDIEQRISSDEYSETCDYEETCKHCGKTFEVNKIKKLGYSEQEFYNCPYCNTEYHTRATFVYVSEK